jgi:hypothetical protein
MREDIEALLEKKNIDMQNILVSEDIKLYVQKLVDNACINCFYERGILQGFIAFYANDFTTRVAFLSMICASNNNYRLGTNLLNGSMSISKEMGFEKYRLEVHKTNKIAILFYEKFEFVIKRDIGDTFIMEKNL